MQNKSASFSSKRIKTEAIIRDEVSCRSVKRFLNRERSGYRQAREKGLLTAADKKRVKFAKTILKKLKDDFWTKGIGFYFEGVGFVHKINPYNEARSSGVRNWRKAGEGLVYTCKSKKKKKSGKTAVFWLKFHLKKVRFVANNIIAGLMGKCLLNCFCPSKRLPILEENCLFKMGNQVSTPKLLTKK